MRRRFLITYSPGLGYHVDLPRFQMIPGTWRPIIAGGVNIPAGTHPGTGAPTPPSVADVCDGNGIHHLVQPSDPRIAQITVECEIPDTYYGDDVGDIDLDNLRRIYAAHPRYDRADYLPPRPDRPIPKPPR